MRIVISLLTLTALLACSAGTATAADGQAREDTGMTALDEREMSGVSGAQGVVLEIKLLNNIDPITYAPVDCGSSIGFPNPCRMGLEFAARSGIWLMLKDYFGLLHIKDMRMDAGFLPSGNTSYYDASRFKDAAGNNLLPGANPVNQPAILMQYPATDSQTTYDDMLAYLNIGRTWLEYDAGAMPGYARDTTLDSAISMRMAEPYGTGWVPDPENPPDVTLSNHAPARMRFWGTAYVFGF